MTEPAIHIRSRSRSCFPKSMSDLLISLAIFAVCVGGVDGPVGVLGVGTTGRFVVGVSKRAWAVKKTYPTRAIPARKTRSPRAAPERRRGWSGGFVLVVMPAITD